MSKVAKRFMVLGVVSAMVAGTAVSASAEEASYKVLIGCSNQAQSFYAWLSKSCGNQIDQNYPDVTYDIYDIAGDPANVRTLLENAEIGEYNGVIIDCPDQTDYTDDFNAATEAGISVLLVNESDYTNPVVSTVGLNNYGLGYTVGTAAAEMLPENARLLIIQATAGNPGSEDRRNGFVDALEECGRDDVTILAEQNSKDWQKENAMSVMEDWTQIYDETDFDAVYSMCDDMVCGAIEVCTAAGYDTQKLQFYGIDGLANGCLAIKDGTLTATVLQNCDDEAVAGVAALYDMMTGTNTEGQQILLDPTIITSDNVDDIIAIHESNGMMQ